jgi:hypothetical protein
LFFFFSFRVIQEEKNSKIIFGLFAGKQVPTKKKSVCSFESHTHEQQQQQKKKHH